MWGDESTSPPVLFPANIKAAKVMSYVNVRSENIGLEILQIINLLNYTLRDADKVLHICIPIWRKLNAASD